MPLRAAPLGILRCLAASGHNFARRGVDDTLYTHFAVAPASVNGHFRALKSAPLRSFLQVFSNLSRRGVRRCGVQVPDKHDTAPAVGGDGGIVVFAPNKVWKYCSYATAGFSRARPLNELLVTFLSAEKSLAPQSEISPASIVLRDRQSPVPCVILFHRSVGNDSKLGADIKLLHFEKVFPQQ